LARIFDASCAAGIVTVEGKPVVPVTILSEGVKPSTGVALLQGNKLSYLTSNASDIKDLIQNMSAILDQIVLALTGIDAVTTVPGSNAAAIALVTTLKTTLLTAQGNLLK
jgi:hypothetical protein